ncbi:PH domain-containing protein [Arthrobacter sp. 18067]|uniref:PH domain-containing protein n=1 Tax=Arthrobacter sp. 18067 TaxID=2681413 RepID=UPI00135C7F8E|nr:PH domain-containing protein [Arthrobacter sp. 18067]
MAKIDKLQQHAADHLDPNESALAVVLGSYETKILGSDSVRSGILIATEKRLVFYAKKLGGYDLESFGYRNISSFEQSKSPMGHKISFFASGNRVSMKWIVDALALAAFTETVKSHLSAAHESAPPPTSIIRGTEDKNEIFEQLQKLGALRDAGIVTAEEFDAKKAEMLARL